ncbi:ribonuclease III [Roseospira marina]|uniref:Ribonuclease 3 n=1 Tax=Roseospira marina TaxID=140057 RepID=A0A5M6I9E9_9PROT|nr:ribonuclease III [Roseospira marina]KAA5604597.1 ribonuclease III [Roseospira marina]MBB4315348.1 ribonuclease-3 [Roseospira marina]MBB5088347.1 ribonuclease-3 [Roseospira marina]
MDVSGALGTGDSLAPLESRLGHTFGDATLLAQALTHGSAGGGPRSYERLEFLGDRVLSLVVAHMLFTRFPAEPEGALARRHTALVRAETLARVARNLGLPALMRLSRGEADLGGRENPALLCDVCEAVLGALYLDGGYASVDRFIRATWAPLMEENPAPPKDAKTALQEWAQGRGLPLPVYETVATAGPAHAPLFTVAARVEGHDAATAEGPSKRQAEQRAAARLMDRLTRS